MKEFLSYLQISEGAISLYLECLGKLPFSYSELYLMTEKLSIENLDETIEELVNAGIMLQMEPQKPEILMHYLAIPPISAILSYYANIDQNLPQILEQIKQFVLSSLGEALQGKGEGTEELKSIEEDSGRQSGNKNDVPLDLDILTYNGDVFYYESKQVPDPNLIKYSYIAVPLSEIAPDFRHPANGKTIEEILANLDDKEKIRKV